MKKDRIFISYRRSDAAGSTIAIRKTLIDRFGQEAVFHDVDGIDPGAEFPQALRHELEQASVVLAVIGKAWLFAANEFGQRRIDFEDDWVRTELSIALSDPDVITIPVLVDGAHIPPDKALPSPLKSLTTRNAVTLRHEAWDDTIARLLGTVEKILAPDKVPAATETLEPAMGSLRGNRNPNQNGASGAFLTLDLIRKAVTDALESVNDPSRQVMRSTADELSRMIARMNARQLEPDHKPMLELLTSRLLERSVVEVAGCMQDVLRYTFWLSATEGKWLGYALKQETRPFEQLDLLGCVLILPKGNAVPGVLGAVIVEKVTFDFYGASMNDGPFIEVSPALVEVGYGLGAIKTGRPGELALVHNWDKKRRLTAAERSS